MRNACSIQHTKPVYWKRDAIEKVDLQGRNDGIVSVHQLQRLSSHPFLQITLREKLGVNAFLPNTHTVHKLMLENQTLTLQINIVVSERRLRAYCSRLYAECVWWWYYQRNKGNYTEIQIMVLCYFGTNTKYDRNKC